MSFLRSCYQVLGESVRVFRRFPLGAAGSALVTLCLLVLQAGNAGFDDGQPWVKLALLGGLIFLGGIFSDLLAARLSRGVRARLSGYAVVLLLVTLYGFYMPEMDSEPAMAFWVRYFLTVLLLHFSISLAGRAGAAGGAAFWNFNAALFLRFCFSAVNSAIAFIGLALAILSADNLFGLGIDGGNYLRLWIVCAFFLHPLLFLGGVPEAAEDGGFGKFPGPLRFTLRFIALPLVLVYLLIVYL